MRKQKLLYLALLVGALIVAALFPKFAGSNYILRVGILAMINVALVGSLNLVNGYIGQFNLSHVGFYCVGAYTAAILSTRYHFSFWLLLPLSGLMAAAVSMLLGVPTLRLKGVFFTITTLGFSEIIRMTVLNWESLTRGTMGIPGIPYPVLFGMKLKSNAEFYWIILGIAIVAYISIYLLINSRIGRAWIAIREDEAAARSMGVETYKYKLMNLAISAFWAGVVGCFYAFFSAYVSADSFKLDESFSMVAMLLVGGQGTMLGPAVGAIVLTVLPEVFRSLVEYRLVIFGAAIVIMILLRPQGIVGGFRLANFQLPHVKPAKPGKGA